MRYINRDNVLSATFSQESQPSALQIHTHGGHNTPFRSKPYMSNKISVLFLIFFSCTTPQLKKTLSENNKYRSIVQKTSSASSREWALIRLKINIYVDLGRHDLLNQLVQQYLQQNRLPWEKENIRSYIALKLFSKTSEKFSTTIPMSLKKLLDLPQNEINALPKKDLSLIHKFLISPEPMAPNIYVVVSNKFFSQLSSLEEFLVPLTSIFGIQVRFIFPNQLSLMKNHPQTILVLPATLDDTKSYEQLYAFTQQTFSYLIQNKPAASNKIIQKNIDEALGRRLIKKDFQIPTTIHELRALLIRCGSTPFSEITSDLDDPLSPSLFIWKSAEPDQEDNVIIAIFNREKQSNRAFSANFPLHMLAPTFSTEHIAIAQYGTEINVSSTFQKSNVVWIAGRLYQHGWQGAQQRYEDISRSILKNSVDEQSWHRTSFDKKNNSLQISLTKPEFGIGVHIINDAHLQKAKALGIKLLRFTIYWKQVEDSRGHYSLSMLQEYDHYISLMTKYGMQPLLVIHSAPDWHSWSNRFEAYQEFGKFVTMLIKRWPSVHYWELWNEWDNNAFTDLFGSKIPNYPAFEKGKNYAEFLIATYPSLKQRHPEKLFLLGGLSYGETEPLLRGIYAGGGKEFFDIVNVHAYGLPLDWGVLNTGYAARKTMNLFNDKKAMWITEFGLDAGNIWLAWNKRHGKEFDEIHLTQWQKSIDVILKCGFFQKYLPYQLYSLNETAKQELSLDKKIKIPFGYTLDDYGFGILRKDLSPRPTYHWLLNARLNSHFFSRVQVHLKDIKESRDLKSQSLVLENVELSRSSPLRISLTQNPLAK